MTHERPRVAVSSCLLGEPVRFNGGHSRQRFLTDRLAGHVDWIPVCPEMEIGLGAPRPALRLLDDGRLTSRDGTADHTGAMVELAASFASRLAEADGYVTKSRSPSCGLRGVPRYSATSEGPPVDRRSAGLFVTVVLEALPSLPAEEDGRLNDALLREHFVERIFAQARLRRLLAGDWRPRDLVAFHSRHKLQILAHDPARYRLLGRIVAGAGRRRRTDLADDYRGAFGQALATRARRGRNVNALHHLLGPIGERLNRPRRHDVLAVVDAYARGEVPLSVPVALLRHHAIGEEVGYLADQTYLAPYPDDLALRHYL